MATDDHATRVGQILSEAREEAMTREERLEAEVAEARRELREMSQAFLASRKPKRWIHMLDDYVKEMEWWQWLFFGWACGLCLGFGLFL